MAGLTRKERLKEQGRQEILEAAMVLFGEKGFHGVSMHEIAGKAGVAVGTLYNFFHSKEDLYIALMEVCVNGVAEVLMPILEDPRSGPLDKVRGVIEAHERIVRENAPYIRLSQSLYSSQWAAKAAKAGIEDKAKSVIDDIQLHTVEVFREGIEQGVFRDVDPVLMAELLRSILETSAMLGIQGPDRACLASMNRALETLLLYGMVKTE